MPQIHSLDRPAMDRASESSSAAIFVPNCHRVGISHIGVIIAERIGG
jgi:hypothetical protein